MGRLRCLTGIALTASALIRAPTSHLMPQEGDNGDDHHRAHEERRSEGSQGTHQARDLSGMDTTLAGTGS